MATDNNDDNDDNDTNTADQNDETETERGEVARFDSGEVDPIQTLINQLPFDPASMNDTDVHLAHHAFREEAGKRRRKQGRPDDADATHIETPEGYLDAPTATVNITPWETLNAVFETLEHQPHPMATTEEVADVAFGITTHQTTQGMLADVLANLADHGYLGHKRIGDEHFGPVVDLWYAPDLDALEADRAADR